MNPIRAAQVIERFAFRRRARRHEHRATQCNNLAFTFGTLNRLIPRTRVPFEPGILVVTGGTGGVGASTVSWCIGRELVRREKSVLLVDMDLYAPSHVLRLNEPPSRPIDPIRFGEGDDDWRSAIRAGDRRTPDILTLASARQQPLLKPSWRASQLVALFRSTNYDYVIVDLPSYATPLHASLFALSDVPILVTTTEPGALSGATHTLRSAIVYGILHHPDADRWERALIDATESLPWDADRSTIEHLMRQRNLPPHLLEDTLSRFRCSLVLNQTRDQAESNLAESIALSWGFLLGSRPHVAGTLPFDDQRWFHQRSGEQPDYELGDERAGEIRALIAGLLLERRDAVFSDGPLDADATGLHLLGLQDGVDSQIARTRYRALWEGFRRQSALTRFVVDPHLREDILSRLEQANRDVIRHLPSVVEAEGSRFAASVHTTGAPSLPARKLERARLDAGISRRELSLQTRVGLRYVEAICEYQVESFPREVYLRGYLTELARALGLDQDQFVAEYLAAVHEQRQKNRLR